MKFKQILFVCTGNTCRSPLAEYLLRKALQDRGIKDVEVKSAGVATYSGMSSPPEVLRILEKYDIDGTQHKSQSLSPELVDWADLILTMETGHRLMVASRFPRTINKVHVLKDFVGAEGNPDILDPIGKSQKIYDACSIEILSALSQLFDHLKEADRKNHNSEEI